MKTPRFFWTLFLTTIVVFISYSCGSDDDPSPEPTPTPMAAKIEIPATENTKPVFSTEGGTATVTFTASQAWMATAVNTRADSWLTVSPTSGGAGTVTLTISAATNETYDERAATITIKSGTASQTVNVTQKQKDALTISSDKVEMDADGGEFTIEVKANIDFSVKADVDWLTQATTRALTTSALKFVAAENETTAKREGHIILSSGNFTETVSVYQAAKEPAIVLTKNNYAINADGEVIAVELQSNVNVVVTMPKVDWISEAYTRAMSTHTYYFVVDKNDGYDSRTAEILFTDADSKLSEKVTITQMQHDAIVVALNSYDFTWEGGNLNLDVQTNVDVTAETNDDWITQADTRGLHTEQLAFVIKENLGESDRIGSITLTGSGVTQVITIRQAPDISSIKSERDVLMALYRATGGDQWKHNDNWGSDKPLKDWYGISIDPNTNLIWAIELSDNNLKGNLPSSIGTLGGLRYLHLANNELEGPLPSSLSGLTYLISIWLTDNKLTGNIPEGICKLGELKFLALDYNQLSGAIPESIGKLTKLEELYLSKNKLSGGIPTSIGELVNLKNLWIFSNDLTGTLPASMLKLQNLESLLLYNNRLDGVIPESIFGTAWWQALDVNLMQQDGYRLRLENIYASTDFSRDGEVAVVQEHSLGKGIRLVITGDAFSDRLIADGTFSKQVRKAVDAFFRLEPYASFREYFDIYSVVAVSKHELIDEDIAFSTKHLAGSSYSIDYEKVKSYVEKVSALNNDVSNVTTLVILNESSSSSRVHCQWWEDGFSIGLCTVSEEMASEINHEVGGHGFAKLADEYWADDTAGTTYPTSAHAILDNYHKIGWFLNVDYHSDPQQVLWKDFISNPAYAVEGIGVYEGGLSEYTYGIYRPTKTSVMLDSEGGYNAPSRWAIYQKIAALANASCTFEEFLKYDERNLSRMSGTRNYVERSSGNVDKSKLGAPPVIHRYPSSEIGRR